MYILDKNREKFKYFLQDHCQNKQMGSSTYFFFGWGSQSFPPPSVPSPQQPPLRPEREKVAQGTSVDEERLKSVSPWPYSILVLRIYGVFKFLAAKTLRLLHVSL